MDYLFLVRPTKHTAAIVVLAGFVLSLTIECTQWFLPTRDSDMTDVITNTIGTALGVALYRLPRLSELWNKLSEHIIARCVRTVNSIKSFENTGQVQR
jgi:glycopeptide antibiotics resistance protein